MKEYDNFIQALMFSLNALLAFVFLFLFIGCVVYIRHANKIYSNEIPETKLTKETKLKKYILVPMSLVLSGFVIGRFF